MSRPKKKYILFLVEGGTDIEVLREPISLIYEETSSPEELFEIKFCLMEEDDGIHGDITSRYGVNPENIEGMINKLFTDPLFEKNQFIYPKEIYEIIQIVDLDGAFIPGELVVENKDLVNSRVCYSEKIIEAVDADYIRERNKRKSENLKTLINMDKIVIRRKNGRNTKTVNYSVYYFSSNMDHVIHNKLNLTQTEKTKLADEFSLNESLMTLKKIIYSEDVACNNMTYQESWNCIMKNNESLKRRSNLNILLDKLYKTQKEM